METGTRSRAVSLGPRNFYCAPDCKEEGLQRPLKATILGEIPPSSQLCAQAYLQDTKTLREVLALPTKNVVRKIVMESQVPTLRGFPYPAQIPRKVSLEDVMRLLREEEGV